MEPGNYESTEVLRCADVIGLVFRLTGGEGFIAGGFARYCVSRNADPIVPADIDVFCGDEEAFDRIVTRIRSDKNTVRKSETRIETKFEYRFSSGYHKDAYAIQIIKPANIKNMVSDGDVRRVLDNFDFTIAKSAVLPDGTALCHENFHRDDEHNALVITNIHCPISSAKRVVKYATKGYSVTSAELLKLFEDYETRSPEWKDAIRAGLRPEGSDALLGPSATAHAAFIELMYFD